MTANHHDRIATPRWLRFCAVAVSGGMLAVCGCHSAQAASGNATYDSRNVYAYSDDDGVVNLSNQPGDARYRLLVPALAASPSDDDRGRKGAVIARLPASAEIRRLVDDAAHAHQVEPALVYAVMSVESGFDSRVISAKGARGLMQLLPVTAAQYGASDLFDPRQNIDAGTLHLRSLLDIFHGDKTLALAAYNAGVAAVARHGNRIPPYPETATYVPRVLDRYRLLLRLLEPGRP